MNPKEYKYTKEHEWLFIESSKVGRIGITDYAQSKLGDIVFLELPSVGTQVKQFHKIGELESLKAVSDIFTPVSGKVLDINQSVISDPSLVNSDPYGNGWLIRLEISGLPEIDTLMSSEEYDRFIGL
jgi:glycine cleavage system H protein